MNNKALILGMYLVALFIILRHWYKDPNNSGMPYPTTITAPSYLYAVLGLTSDAIGGLGTVLAVGLTVGLYWAVQKNNKLGRIISVSASGPTSNIDKAAVQSGKLNVNSPKKKAKTK